jgi:AcrR family transcriptional regulator
MSSDAPRRGYNAEGRREAARRNRAAVLEAFRELLLQDGFQATTVQSVAERAGVSAPTVYKAFGGKPGMVKALWDITLAGDDEPVAMSERPQLREVWRTGDVRAKLRLYAGFVRGVHERLAELFTLLTQAGPEVAEVLELSGQERLIGLTAFVGHLGEIGALRSDADPAQLVDAAWALTGPHLFIQLTRARGWTSEAYQAWLARLLGTELLGGRAVEYRVLDIEC